MHSGGAVVSLFASRNLRFGLPLLPENATLLQKVKHFLKLFHHRTYPYLNATYYFSTLGFSLLYLFNRTPYHTPFHFLARLRMRRLTSADHHAHNVLMNPPSKRGHIPGQGAGSLFSRHLWSDTVLPRVLDSFRVLLPTSIFFLKFLEWWYASDFARQLNAKTSASVELPVPDGIEALRVQIKGKDLQGEGVSSSLVVVEDGKKKTSKVCGEASPRSSMHNSKKLVKVPEDSSLCPICGNELQNPTAAQTGYVFDYTCVFRWIEDEGEYCPITGVKLLSGTGGLRRLMV